MQYILCRIADDATSTPINGYGSIVEGIAAGKHMVEVEDFDYAYCLHSNGTRLATFAEGQIGYREWARCSGRFDYIHSLDDRYDKDVDDLIS